MTYAEYIFCFIGYQERYFRDFEKHRVTAYQVYLSVPRYKGRMPLSIQRFLPLPSDDLTFFSKDKTEELRALWLEKIRKEKQSKNT